eukprot:6936336-Prymnesium_polylepis.2
MNNSTHYADLARAHGGWFIHDNEALRGSHYQNAHWDVYAPATPADTTQFIIDIPLTDVHSAAGGPLNVWPGTHRVDYQSAFGAHFGETYPQRPPAGRNHDRQYYHCYAEMEAFSAAWPNALLFTTLGDFVVRFPWTWHRGTPNLLRRSRHMLSLIFGRR